MLIGENWSYINISINNKKFEIIISSRFRKAFIGANDKINIRASNSI